MLRDELFCRSQRYHTLLGIPTQFTETQTSITPAQKVQDQLLKMSVRSGLVTVALLGEIFHEIYQIDNKSPVLPKLLDATLSAADAASRAHHARYIHHGNLKGMMELMDIPQPASLQLPQANFDHSVQTVPPAPLQLTQTAFDNALQLIFSAVNSSIHIYL